MRVASCCCTTNISGPLPGAASFGAGSGVALKLRLAEYSESFSFAIPVNYDHARDRRCERLLLQGMEGQLLPGQDEARGDAAVLLVEAADGGDQQHVLPDAQDGDAGELAEDHPRDVPVCDQGVAAHHAPGAPE